MSINKKHILTPYIRFSGLLKFIVLIGNLIKGGNLCGIPFNFSSKLKSKNYFRYKKEMHQKKLLVFVYFFVLPLFSKSNLLDREMLTELVIY